MRLDHRVLLTHTKRPFRIATGARDAFPVVVVRLEHDGVVGYGEGAPSARVTGEDAASVGRFLDWAAGEVADLHPRDWRRFLRHVHEDICGNPTARCALDLALHDLVGKLEGEPARWLHDVPDARLETSITVSLDAPEVMAEEARGYLRQGFRCIKLKLGDPPRDAARVAAVREAAPDARLRADANTGWSLDEARRLMPVLARHEVEFVEQPLRADMVREMAELSRESPLPLYADESVLDAADVARLAKAGFRGGVNLKLMKTGGIVPALAAARAAREAGYHVQMGCMIEGACGIAGAVQLLALLDHADLDGQLLLRDDPFDGPAPVDGWYETPDAPGLAVRAVREA